MKLSIRYEITPKQPTVRTSRVMDAFGISFEQGQHVMADDLELDVRPSQIVAFTGPSGSGKSSLLRAVVERLSGSSKVVDIDALDLGDEPLIDALPGSVNEAMRLLSVCGLGEAQLMLRTPAELSEGQRYRFRLALAVSQKPDWIVADEFTATLDRTLAKVVAAGVRRIQTSVDQLGVLAATTHDDVIDSLVPNVHVRCDLDGDVEVIASKSCKKKDAAHSTINSGPAKRPVPTGRTSLGGITAHTRSA